jgi:hypothetical protein
VTNPDDLSRNDPRLDELLLAACRERGINSVDDLRREFRADIARQTQPDPLVVRIEAALAARPHLSSLLDEQWRFCVQTFGHDSGAARGALLDLVREAWDDPYIVTVVGSGWSWVERPRCRTTAANPFYTTELDALVVALEAAPT